MSEIENDTRDEHADAEFYKHFLDNGHPKLAESFVCLLDVLGTSAGTQKEAESFLRVTHTALDRAKAEYESPHLPTMVRWFSDNAAIAFHRYGSIWGDEGTSQINGISTIVLAGTIQLELSKLGLFLRGGIDAGPFFASRQFVYGPALVDAHLLENEVAVYPRIVLSKGLAKYASKQATEASKGFPWNDYRELLAVDNDGEVFVNYLRLVEDKEEPIAWLTNHLYLVQSHRQEAADERIRQKYDWVARYHDSYCRRFLEHHPELEKLLDDPSSTCVLEPLS